MMSGYGEQRYQIIRELNPNAVICRDQNLDREVCIHWVAQVTAREAVRSRLVALQTVRSPYVALVYDLVEAEGWVGVVEENLDDPIAATNGDLHRLYQFCAGLAALHDNQLGHGALNETSFRTGPFGHGRLCNLAFDRFYDPSSDRLTFAERLRAMGAALVQDSIFQGLYASLETLASPQPPAGAIRDRLAALLLRDQHRALVYWRGSSIEMNAGQRFARFTHPSPGVADVTIYYDGTGFYLSQVTGEVRVNNIPPSQGQELPDSCVIALGDRDRPWHQRYFITFDQSHPEVV